VVQSSLITFCILLAGCSSSNDRWMAPVGGQVTYQGKPVANATVAFLCPGAPRPSVGTTDDSGNYRLTTFEQNDGAIVGTHAVTVNVYATEAETSVFAGTTDVGGKATAKSIDDAMKRSVKQIEKAEKSKPPIPLKYADRRTSDLRKEVVAGENKINIELTN
jgi:hypothetical protein